MERAGAYNNDVEACGCLTLCCPTQMGDAPPARLHRRSLRFARRDGRVRGDHPNSFYSASKAASDHLARAWKTTFGLPVIVTNCSNNYGPCRFPEKLIPVVILKALADEPIPVYGRGDMYGTGSISKTTPTPSSPC